MKRASSAVASLGAAHRPMSAAQNTLCPLGCGRVLDMTTDGAGRLVETCPRHGVVGRHRPHLVVDGAAGLEVVAAQAPGRIERVHVSAPLPYAVGGRCPHCEQKRPACVRCLSAPRAEGRLLCASCRSAPRPPSIPLAPGMCRRCRMEPKLPGHTKLGAACTAVIAGERATREALRARRRKLLPCPTCPDGVIEWLGTAAPPRQCASCNPKAAMKRSRRQASGR